MFGPLPIPKVFRDILLIREQGTAISYGCNVNLKGVWICHVQFGILGLYKTTLRHQRSHLIFFPIFPLQKKVFQIYITLVKVWKHSFTSSYIITIHFSLPVFFFFQKCFRDYALETGSINTFSPINRLVSICCGVALSIFLNMLYRNLHIMISGVLFQIKELMQSTQTKFFVTMR